MSRKSLNTSTSSVIGDNCDIARPHPRIPGESIDVSFGTQRQLRRQSAALPVEPGFRCLWNSKTVQIIAVLNDGLASAFDEIAGEVLTIPIDQLRAMDSPSPPKTYVLPTSEQEWGRAVALCAEFRRFAHATRIPRAEASRLGRQFNLTVRSILRLRSRYMLDPRASALVPKTPGRKPGSWSINYRVEVVIAHTITRHYLKRERATLTEVIARIRSLCRRLNLPPPSPNTVKLRLASEDPENISRKRMGSKFAKQQYQARPGMLSVTRPLALCQIDHTLVDVLVLSDDRTQVIGRPWLTVAMCVATRVVLGFYLTFDAPCGVSVAMCLAHAASPKSAENRDVPGRWPMYGKPETILVDNGKDFRGEALQRGCEQHGITLTWRPVATPHYGGHIERLMGTLMTLVKGLPGATSSNSKERGDYKSEDKAAMTLEEVRRWLTSVICDYYHARVHRILELPPVVAWERQWTGDDGVLRSPPLIRNLIDFQLDFYPYEMRLVHRSGVEFKRSRYWHPALSRWVGRKVEVVVRYDPRDLTRVYIRTADGEDIEANAVAGRAITGRVAPMTMEESARIEERIDRRFADGDLVVTEAVSHAKKVCRSAAQRRPLKGRGGLHLRDGKAKASKVASLPPPNRRIVTSEELD